MVMQRCDATVWPVVQVAALQMCFCSQVDFLHKTERSNTNRFNHTARLDFPNILGICDAIYCSIAAPFLMTVNGKRFPEEHEGYLYRSVTFSMHC